MPSLMISEMQFHFMEVRPVFTVPRCMPFHLTVLEYMHECVLANKKKILVTTPAIPANVTCFASVPISFQVFNLC